MVKHVLNIFFKNDKNEKVMILFYVYCAKWDKTNKLRKMNKSRFKKKMQHLNIFFKKLCQSIYGKKI